MLLVEDGTIGRGHVSQEQLRSLVVDFLPCLVFAWILQTALAVLLPFPTRCKSSQKREYFQVNEAFAAQYLAVEKELGLDRSKTNLNGGAIALGHPLGASGSRIMAHLTHELRRTGKKYAVGSACIGGGQGIAIIVENVA